jgi:hypothetical protein
MVLGFVAHNHSGSFIKVMSQEYLLEINFKLVVFLQIFDIGFILFEDYE